MSWYKDSDDGEGESTNTDESVSRTVREDVGTDPREEYSNENSQDITIESDADNTPGQYSRDEPISFREAREKAQRSREAAESRGEAPEESPLSDHDESEENVEDESESEEGSASTDASDEDATVTDTEEWHDAVRDHFKNDALDEGTILATGKTNSGLYEFMETSVDGQTVYAMIEDTSTGVAYQKLLGNYGTSLSTPSVSIDTDVLEDAVAGERKIRKRQTRYQDVDVVGELSVDQVTAVEHYYREVATELAERALLASESERERNDVSVSVVDNYVVVAGVGVTERIEDLLGMWTSDKQVDVILDALSEAVQETDERIPDEVRTEISRQETLSGGECVVAARLSLR